METTLRQYHSYLNHVAYESQQYSVKAMLDSYQKSWWIFLR